MKKIISLAVLPLVLAACAGSESGISDYNSSGYIAEESLGGSSYAEDSLMVAAPKYVIGTPYKIEDVQYVPAEDLSYNQTGIAGIIPADLNGALTPNGETFSSDQMMATSKTLPLPSIVKVTNLENGQFANVRVNNRGPFVNSRIMDVSSAVARKLGMSGQTKVQVQILADKSIQVKNATMGTEVTPTVMEPVAETPVASGPYSVQLGAFYSEDGANALANRVSYVGKATVVNEAGLYKVRINDLDAPAARSAIDTLRSSESMSPGLLKDGKWVNADSI